MWDGTQTYGDNIKHYVQNEKTRDNIPLYKDEDSVNIFSDAAYRYYDKETLIALRYISANRNFFKEIVKYTDEIPQKQAFSTILKSISILNSNYFLRADSPLIDSANDLGNVFYILNNLVVPTSIIYKNLLSYLKENLNGKGKAIVSMKMFEIGGDFTQLSEIKEENIVGKGKNRSKYATRYLTFPTANVLTSKKNFSVKFKGFSVKIKDLYDAIK